jgi:hypothetical protein
MTEFVNSTETQYTKRIQNDFDNLKNEVIANSDILKEFSTDDIIEFYKKSNIYSRKCLDADKHNKQFTLLSYINGREDFFKKLSTTVMISYMFRQCLDYKINITDLNAVINDDDFLEEVPNKYKKDPAYHRKVVLCSVKHNYINDVYDIDYDLADLDQKADFMNFQFTDEDLVIIEQKTDEQLEELMKTEYAVNKELKFKKIQELVDKQSKDEQLIIYKFLKNTFSFNPDRHIKNSYKYEQDVDTYEDYKKQVLSKVEDDVKKELNISDSIIKDNVPSDNLLYNFNNYYEMHYDLFKVFVNLLYKVESDRDLLINIHGQFDTKEDVDKFVKLNEANFITSPVLINNNEWKMFAKYLPNRTNGEVIGQDNQIVNELLDKYKSDSKIAEDMTKMHIKRSKLENMYKHGKNNDQLKDYMNSNIRDVNTISSNDNSITDEEYQEFENRIQSLSKPKEDDDFAIQYKIFKSTESGLDSTTIYQ